MHQIFLNDSKETYTLEFIESLGYKNISLQQEDLLKIFILLSRAEEYESQLKHNNHNWEICYAEAKRISETLRPPIESYIKQWEEEGKIIRNIHTEKWPNGKTFALCLTHDMDILSNNLFFDRVRSLRSYWKAPRLQKIIIIASTFRELVRKIFMPSKSSPLLLSEWLDLEDKYGFKSSMLFLAQPLVKPSWEDSFYRYSDTVLFNKKKIPIGKAMKQISDRGWDVGLHGSTNSHASCEILHQEKKIISAVIGQNVSTIRQHHLTYDIRYTSKYQANAGLRADSSLGSNISSCYRCGTGYPFYQYDLIEDKKLDILQIPLVIQDVALFRHLKMDEETAYSHCMELIRGAHKNNSAITLLWHNNYKSTDIEYKVYSRILKESYKLGAWGCSMEQLRKHWLSKPYKTTN